MQGKIGILHRRRLYFFCICVFAAYCLLSYNLFELTIADFCHKNQYVKNRATRANIVDCNNNILATNVSTLSLYAHPHQIANTEQVVASLHKIFPYLSKEYLVKKLQPSKYFSWIKKHISAIEHEEVAKLGIVGLNFIGDQKRFYPHGRIASHLVGYVNTDNNGQLGIERYYEAQLNGNMRSALRLGVDIRVQQILHRQLADAILQNSASGGVGVVMDVRSGLIKAAISLPDFDPNARKMASDKSFFNQFALGVFEMGSVFKTLTVAMALNEKVIHVNDAFDVNAPIYLGKWRIGDYKAKGGFLSVPEILKYSSNIGTVQINRRLGIPLQKRYLKELGMLSKLPIDLSENAAPIYASRWSEITAATMSYGHGIAITPLQVLAAFSSTINGGMLYPPHFKESEVPIEQLANIPDVGMWNALRLKCTSNFNNRYDSKIDSSSNNQPLPNPSAISHISANQFGSRSFTNNQLSPLEDGLDDNNGIQSNNSSDPGSTHSSNGNEQTSTNVDSFTKTVFTPSTSKTMRQLLRLVVTEGFSKKADVEGYFVGAKTGTAEKVGAHGGYNKKANFAFFIGAFPIFDPKYIVFIGIDEGKPNERNFGYTTGGMIAAPVGGEVIRQIAPLLGVRPILRNDARQDDIENQLYVEYKPRYKAQNHQQVRG